MKILIVHNYYQISGGEDTVVANEKKLLEENGNEVILYIRDNAEIKKYTGISKVRLVIITLFNPRTYVEIRQIIKKNKIDIVHIHNTLNFISPSVYYAALSMKIPVVQTMHNFRMLCPSAIFYRGGHICEECMKYGLRRSVKHGCYRDSRFLTAACALNLKLHRKTGIYRKINYICLTEFNRNKLIQLNYLPKVKRKQIVDPSKIFIKPNFTFLDTSNIKKEKIGEHFIYVGRLDETKGIKILLEAWRLMGKNAPQLFVFGNGPMKEWCNRYTSNHQLTQVTLMGFIPNAQVREKIAEAEALIIPTQVYEGFPMTLVEAIAIGTPVIGSDHGNVGNMIQDGINGVTFCHNSAEALVRAVRSIQANPIYMKEENKNIYSPSKNYKTLMSIYEKIMEQYHGLY